MAHTDSKRPLSPLMQAAHALDEELQRFEELTESLEGSSFNSQKGLERAAKVLTDVSDADERLGARVRTLVEAITLVRERQQAQAERVQVRAAELQQRTEVYGDLLRRYEALGKVAGELNGLMQQLASRPAPVAPADPSGELVASIQELHAPLERVVGGAEELQQAANNTGFGDLARQADSLRQQLLSARNRLNLLHRSLSRS
jgi:chromosome segregation ATPase